MKIVWKPWGYEEWLELNDRYCFKRIMLHAGQSTSLQYHNEKLETNRIVSGKGTLLLGTQPDKTAANLFAKYIEAGDSFTIAPGQVHRITAITDLEFFEVSTPEVDDVIRLDDEWSRSNGRIESEHAQK